MYNQTIQKERSFISTSWDKQPLTLDMNSNNWKCPWHPRMNSSKPCLRSLKTEMRRHKREGTGMWLELKSPISIFGLGPPGAPPPPSPDSCQVQVSARLLFHQIQSLCSYTLALETTSILLLAMEPDSGDRTLSPKTPFSSYVTLYSPYSMGHC